MILIQKAHQGDKEARETLIKNNLGLVWSIVHRFENRGHELEDLFQIGSIGLMKAIDKFDFGFEVRFSTYAVPLITGEIKRFLRDDGMIKVSRSLKENAFRIKAAEEQLQKKLGREVTLEELKEVTGMEREEIVMALEANMEVDSIYRGVSGKDGNKMNETFLVDKIAQKKDQNEEVLNILLVEQLLDTLKDQERDLIIQRYFQEKTQMQIGESLGMSQVQVSRLEKKILQRLRRMM